MGSFPETTIDPRLVKNEFYKTCVLTFDTLIAASKGIFQGICKITDDHLIHIF